MTCVSHILGNEGERGGGNVISKTILLGVETYLFVKQKTKAPLQRFH